MPPATVPRSATTSTAIAAAARSARSAPTRRSRSTTRRSTASAATCPSAPRSSRAARPAPAPGTSASWPSPSSAPATSRCSRTRRSTSAPESAWRWADDPASRSRRPPPDVVVGLLMLGGGVAAGAFGSLLGLGGGVLIVPLLTLGFGLPLREAVAVSLVCVIMTSSAAAGVYLERHVANLRLGMTLELFTAIGALVGGSSRSCSTSGCWPSCSPCSCCTWRDDGPGGRAGARPRSGRGRARPTRRPTPLGADRGRGAIRSADAARRPVRPGLPRAQPRSRRRRSRPAPASCRRCWVSAAGSSRCR